mmetsp:Transcript_74757/g.200367  ORF Transcript_74757/g.200367 Transcript_74757/m.200367 type:complete len:90 (+) Transcript_74757:1274-1543(+)
MASENVRPLVKVLVELQVKIHGVHVQVATPATSEGSDVYPLPVVCTVTRRISPTGTVASATTPVNPLSRKYHWPPPVQSNQVLKRVIPH